MGIRAVGCMFELAGDALPAGGPFCLYGPFNVAGRFTSESNRRFDESLRSRDADMGIRDLDLLDEMAAAAGMERIRQYAMPANNMLIVWQKSGG